MAGAEPDAGMCHALLEIFDQQQAAQPAVQLLEECLIEVLIHVLYLCFRLLWMFSKRSLEVLYLNKSKTDLPLAAVAALMQSPEITHQPVMETCTKEGKALKAGICEGHGVWGRDGHGHPGPPAVFPVGQG